MPSPGWEKTEVLKTWSVPAFNAYNGQNCKHMAWRFLYAVEADQKENDVQTELELAQQRMDKEDKVFSKSWQPRRNIIILI